MTDGRPKSPPARARKAATRSCTLTVEIAGEEADETAWTCLGEHDPTEITAEVAAAIAGEISLPALDTTASLMLSDDDAVRLLNKQWRGFDKPTNVLSFPMQAPPGVRGAGPLEIGDIIIAEQTLVREAAEMGISVHDHFRHLVLHGLLHLLGYDHENDDEAEVMEALETRILATLGVADPYAGTDVMAPDGAATPNRPGERLR